MANLVIFVHNNHQMISERNECSMIETKSYSISTRVSQTVSSCLSGRFMADVPALSPAPAPPAPCSARSHRGGCAGSDWSPVDCVPPSAPPDERSAAGETHALPAAPADSDAADTNTRESENTHNTPVYKNNPLDKGCLVSSLLRNKGSERDSSVSVNAASC